MGTNAGGEVIVLDSAGYGPFAINKSISIIASPGAYAGISVFSGDGVDIIVASNDVVILRGLTVNSQGGSAGIFFQSSGTLHVEGCVVSGFSNFGLISDGGDKLEVKDSIFRGNGAGIFIRRTSAVAIDQVRLEANTNHGLVVEERAKVTLRNSVASNNGGAGFVAASTAAAAVELNVEGCVASNNSGAGIDAESHSTGIATIRVSNSTVTDNSFGLYNHGAPALLLSLGNNIVAGNAIADTFGTIGSFTAK